MEGAGERGRPFKTEANQLSRAARRAKRRGQ